MALDALETEGMEQIACSTGNRTKRHRPAADEEYLALCLLMLARGESGHHLSSPPPPTKQSHACSVCGKSFGSYQALGGHKTSHRRPSASEDCGITSGAEEVRAHRCSVCMRTFPSGQALGGHKRLHYDGCGGVASSSEVSESGPSVRNFDLNLPPPPELDLEVESVVGIKKPRWLIPA